MNAPLAPPTASPAKAGAQPTTAPDASRADLPDDDAMDPRHCRQKGSQASPGRRGDEKKPTRPVLRWHGRQVETRALDGARPRTEVLWINPACAAALDAKRNAGTLFEAPAA